VLSGPVVAAEDTAPLINIAPKDLDAPALGSVAQAEEDGEVEIPVPVEDIDGSDEDEEEGDDETPVGPQGGGAPTGRPQLALTGLSMVPPLAAGLMLLLVGFTLRIAVSPSPSSRARA
jgi:hypothetical protein